MNSIPVSPDHLSQKIYSQLDPLLPLRWGYINLNNLAAQIVQLFQIRVLADRFGHVGEDHRSLPAKHLDQVAGVLQEGVDGRLVATHHPADQVEFVELGGEPLLVAFNGEEQLQGLEPVVVDQLQGRARAGVQLPLSLSLSF